MNKEIKSSASCLDLVEFFREAAEMFCTGYRTAQNIISTYCCQVYELGFSEASAVEEYVQEEFVYICFPPFSKSFFFVEKRDQFCTGCRGQNVTAASKSILLVPPLKEVQVAIIFTRQDLCSVLISLHWSSGRNLCDY